MFCLKTKDHALNGWISLQMELRLFKDQKKLKWGRRGRTVGTTTS